MTSRADHDTDLRHDTELRPAIDQVRLAVSELFGAERRLRSRDQNRPGELTRAQIRALGALAREQEMTAGQLARSADLNPASVTAMLDHLEAADIVERRRSTEDRRVCKVLLTDKGRRILQEKLSVWYAVWEERLAQVDDADLEAAARVIGRVAGIFDAVGHHTANDPAPAELRGDAAPPAGTATSDRVPAATSATRGRPAHG